MISIILSYDDACVTYDQLQAFLAVAAEGGFVRASARLHKSQPAVSKLVRNLEEELGVELFDRRAYRATLTDAGRLFAERAAAAVEEADALRSFGARLAGVAEPIVRLAIEAVAPLAPILDVIAAAQARHPGVRVELRTERLSGVADALLEGWADVVVGTTLGLDRRAVEVAPYTRVRIVPVVRADHALAACGPSTRPALLRRHPQIVLRDSTLAADAPSLNVLRGGVRWSVTDVASKRDVIAAGMGWGGLPEHVVAEDVARGELAVIAVPEFEAESMELFAIRSRSGVRGLVAQELWDALAAGPPAAPAPVGARRSADRPSRTTRRSRRSTGTSGGGGSARRGRRARGSA
ncbi:MAG TPA: LysR family transcriptional regulator [Myxococcota bacterium]|nr:LysR family transcriptional regulator [Myxococcota bacterium]